MKFKQINSNGLFCWSPTRFDSCLAIGTTVQQFDTNFSSDNKLEVFALNINDSSEDTSLQSSKLISSAINCMKWHSSGLICGTQLKTLQLYTVSNDIQLSDETEVQTSVFTSLDLNPKESHLLAVGSEDGLVGVWDISKNFKKTLNLNSSSNESINIVKWNRSVPSILASASNSNIHVWDTRKAINSGPIMRVHDNNAASIWGSGPQSLMISRSLVWSESSATTLIIANSNDVNPILQIWDLRYATSPLNSLRGGHSRGIQSISWNKYDDYLLLSAGKDNNVCLWNPLPQTNEPFQAVLPFIDNQWINEVEWCDWEPSLFAINSFDGKTTVYNLTKTNSYTQTTNSTILESFALNSQNQIPQQIQASVQSQPIVSRAPKWLRTPCRASFGFSGKLITYNVIITQTQSQPPVHYTQHVITINQIMTDPELITRAEKLENALGNGNFIDYCLYKISEHSDNENISKAWKLVLLHLENDRQKQRQQLLELLGFDHKKSNDAIDNLCDLTNSQLKTTQMDRTHANQETIDSYGMQSFGIENIVNNCDESKLPDNFNIETSDSNLGNKINGGILTGDLESVVNNCIQNNNWAEAILVCCFVSPEHTASTLRKYFNYCLSSKPELWSPLLWCIITAQTSSDDEAVKVFEEFIARVDLKYWRQVLAFIIRESENWEDINTKSFLIHKLAKRLIDNYEESGVKQWLDAGIYCYIIIGDYINVSKFFPFGNHLDRIELSLILQKCTNSQFVANQLTTHFAKLLAIEGKLDLALKYIDDNEIELKDRIIGNLRPNARHFSPQTQAVAPRVQKTAPLFNRGPTYQNPTHISKPILSQMSSSQPMAPPSAPMSVPYSRPVSTPGPSIPYIPTVPIAPTVAPPVAPLTYQMSQNPVNYGNQNVNTFSEQFSPQPVTPGWNDPPVLNTSRSRHSSFSADGHIHGYNQMATNTISTPLPVIPSDTIEPNVRNISESRPQSMVPSEPLSPQNQQIMDAFDQLISQLQNSSNSQPLNMKRKLEDSRIKMESLRSKLGSKSQLSSNTLSGLTEIANAINRYDFQTALECHSQLVASTTFGETTAFLPAIKVIIHLAQHRFQN